MAKTQDIKRRIRSIRNTMQVTRAMKMVSAAKLRRTQDQMMRARPYAERSLALLRQVATRCDPEDHPLLQVHEGNRVEVVVVTADKGLCGAFNANLIRTAEQYARGLPNHEIKLASVGRRGRDYFRRRGHELERQWVDILRTVDFAIAEEIAGAILELYLDRRCERVVLVFNAFKSAIQARPIVQQLLPVPPADVTGGGPVEEYVYEPSAAQLFETLLPHYVEVQVFHALIESVAAEHAARMTAMDNATNNAAELIESLTLTMNRVRQASITTEIIEVVSGAEALG